MSNKPGCVYQPRNGGNPIALGDFEFRVIRQQALKLVGHAGFTKQDLEDLEQELTIRLLKALESFNPAIAHQRSYVTAVVDRSRKKIGRDARAAKRAAKQTVSIEDQLKDKSDGASPVAESIAESDAFRHRSLSARDRQSMLSLATDIAALLRSLPEQQRELAKNLKTASISAVARQSSIPRTTLNDSVRRLEERFRQSHMEDHL